MTTYEHDYRLTKEPDPDSTTGTRRCFACVRCGARMKDEPERFCTKPDEKEGG